MRKFIYLLGLLFIFTVVMPVQSVVTYDENVGVELTLNADVEEISVAFDITYDVMLIEQVDIEKSTKRNFLKENEILFSPLMYATSDFGTINKILDNDMKSLFITKNYEFITFGNINELNGEVRPV